MGTFITSAKCHFRTLKTASGHEQSVATESLSEGEFEGEFEIESCLFNP